MRRPRCLRRGQEAAYHCMSRTVGGLRLLGEREREVFCRRMWRLAAFCQVKITTHACLANHFHILARVPARVRLSDTKLLQSLEKFYGPEHSQTLEFARALKSPQSPLHQKLRDQYLARMGDLSVFMKELKEGFSKWFNAVHERFGTLWAERFKSVILANGSETLRAVAAYIDLNGVRAGSASAPEDYRFCGYAQAVARAGPAREGLADILPGRNWAEKIAHYRMLLYGKGARARNNRQAVLDCRKALEVYQAGGKLTQAEALLLKVRYFSEGIALGTAEFVQEIFDECRQQYCKVRRQGGWPMQGADWGGLVSLRKIKEPIQPPARQKP